MPAVQRCIPPVLAAILSVAMILIPSPASGAAVVEVEFPACPPANRAMVIDGKLDDWQGIEGKQFLPIHAFDSATVAEDRPDLAATVRFTYDAQSLYASVEWLSPTPPSNTTSPNDATDWQRGGDGVELHLQIGGLVTHVAPSVRRWKKGCPARPSRGRDDLARHHRREWGCGVGDRPQGLWPRACAFPGEPSSVVGPADGQAAADNGRFGVAGPVRSHPGEAQ